MTALIYCPGPSLAHLAAGAFRADLRIGVNRAAILLDCDVWCCGDYPLYRQIHDQIRGSPTWFTAANSAEEIHERGPVRWRGKVITFESIPDPVKSIDWDFFSMLAAIGYAAHAGARSIQLFGADWAGTSDYDGVQAGNTRSEDRWALEKRLFEIMTDELTKTRGIEISRHVS